MTDNEDFETFVRAYQNMVFSKAVRLLGNEAEAEDISQEVFLKAYQRFAELRHSPTVGGWLKKVTTNLCLNHLSRYRARWRFFSELFTANEDDDHYPEIPAPDSTEERIDSIDHRELVEQALRKLPSAQRVPLVLFHFENLSYEEIATSLGVSLSKVKTDIFRAREKLRRNLNLKMAPPPPPWPAKLGSGKTGSPPPTRMQSSWETKAMQLSSRPLAAGHCDL